MQKIIKKIARIIFFCMLIFPKVSYAVTFDFTFNSNDSATDFKNFKTFDKSTLGATFDGNDGVTMTPSRPTTVVTPPDENPPIIIGPGDGNGAPVEVEPCDPNFEICGPNLGPVTQQYICYASTNREQRIIIMMNFYDITGRDVLNEDLTFQNNAKFKSGTWVGVRTAEERYGKWEVTDAHVTEVKNVWTCLWEYFEYDEETEITTRITTTSEVITTYGEDENAADATSICSVQPEICNGECNLVDGQITEHREYESNNEEFLKECINDESNALISEIKTFVNSPSIKVMYIANNIYPKSKSDIELKAVSMNELADSTTCPDLGTPDNPVTSGECWNTWVKYPESVCLNRVTGEVTYDKPGGCDTDNEFDVTISMYDEKEYEYTKYTAPVWRYFIPLNTKTTEGDWYLRIISADGGYLTPPFCYSAMLNYPDRYTKQIIRLNDSEFIGTDENGKSHIDEDMKTAQKDGGCKIALKFEIPIIQEYYNEVTNDNGGKNLQGYGFYYRQIDVNNPFPNGIDNHSYWHNWNVKKESDRIPNIQKSFDEMSYHTGESYNHKNIKNYNSNKEYAGWKGMNVDGTSDFIKQYDYVINDKTSSFYELGCGPSNTDWKDCN